MQVLCRLGCMAGASIQRVVWTGIVGEPMIKRLSASSGCRASPGSEEIPAPLTSSWAVGFWPKTAPCKRGSGTKTPTWNTEPEPYAVCHICNLLPALEDGLALRTPCTLKGLLVQHRLEGPVVLRVISSRRCNTGILLTR